MPDVFLLFPDRSSAAREAALEGIRRAFDDKTQVQTAQSADEALLALHHRSDVVLVLISPELTELEVVLKANSENGLPVWPVIVLGDGITSSGLIAIPSEDWHGPLLAQVLRAAVQQHKLVLENNRLRGDLMTFARRISHDLRTNLSGILATAELLKDILSEHSAEDAELTSPLFDCTQAVLKLIERTSQVARATAEKKAMELVDMTQAVWAGRQAAEQMAVKTAVTITEPEQWPEVMGVQSWMEVVWANLLQFSVQRTGQGGHVELAWKDLQGNFEFSVRDRGPSITAEQRAALLWSFDKLHQGHSTKQLFLPIARRLIELQGGMLDCEAVHDGGLRFVFTLPKVSNAEVPVA